MGEWQPNVYTDREKVLDYVEIVQMSMEEFEAARQSLRERANQLMDVRNGLDLSELSDEEIDEVNKVLNLSFGLIAN
jgi:nucleoid-associated protein YejK